MQHGRSSACRRASLRVDMLARVLARVASGAATHLHVLDQLDVLLHLFLNALRNNTCCAILHDCVWMWVAAVGGGVDMLLALRGIIDADNTDAGGQPSAPPSATAQQAQHGLAKCIKNVCVLLREEHNALLVAPPLLTRSPLERHALARVPLERGPPAQPSPRTRAHRTQAARPPEACRTSADPSACLAGDYDGDGHIDVTRSREEPNPHLPFAVGHPPFVSE